MTIVSRCSVVSYIVQIDYKQLLDLNYMLGGLISYWASFRVRKPRQYSVNVGFAQRGGFFFQDDLEQVLVGYCGRVTPCWSW